MKQIDTQHFNSNDVMPLHQDKSAVRSMNETYLPPEFEFNVDFKKNFHP